MGLYMRIFEGCLTKEFTHVYKEICASSRGVGLEEVCAFTRRSVGLQGSPCGCSECPRVYREICAEGRHAGLREKGMHWSGLKKKSVHPRKGREWKNEKKLHGSEKGKSEHQDQIRVSRVIWFFDEINAQIFDEINARIFNEVNLWVCARMPMEPIKTLESSTKSMRETCDNGEIFDQLTRISHSVGDLLNRNNVGSDTKLKLKTQKINVVRLSLPPR